MNQERLSFMALHFVPGVGNILVKQLISYCGSAENVFKLPKSRMLKIPGIGEITADSISKGRTLHEAEATFRKAERENTTILCYMDKAYPYRLKHIEDAPSFLYVKGNTNLNASKAVAIVGTRQATTYGKEQVERLMEDIKPHGALIISGLAYGIDIHAHKQALKFGLSTVGVLGSGIDVIYPAAHKDTAGKMTNQGGLVTENHFGTKPDAHNFPSRNRIIAGMCDALIVVEAAEKGGALITAEIANSYNKDVFAIPGNLGHTFSEGCNKLIKINKANLLMSVKDLEYIMNWNTGRQPNESQLSLDLPLFEPQEQAVLKALQDNNRPMMIDELSFKTGIGHGLLSSLLLTLEFKNVVSSLPGKVYKLGRM
ncbi:MAG TPA: DNA-processing protein DprA [Cyclobacteriaceae bacterium]|nr:DNA-processing protein DprA [Cyclobacteriaceae bacterium]